MTPSELKYNIEQTGRDSHFFSRSTMKFFGDTMRNYGVRSAVIRTNYDSDGNWTNETGVEVEVWELFRKRAVKAGNKESAYFDKQTFKRVYPTTQT